MPEPALPLVAAKLLKTATEIIGMAEDLRDRGFPLEGLEFALIAMHYLRAARALQRLADA